MSLIRTVRNLRPSIPDSCFLAETAQIIGDVNLGERCSVWYNVVLRGDVMPIKVGEESNLQDGTIIHGTYKKCGTRLGRRVSVGHRVTLHGCEVGDHCLIGMGAIIMDKAKIPSECLVAAGSLVTENSQFESGWLILGRPAKAVRKLKSEEIEFLHQSADNYLKYSSWYEGEEKSQ